MRSWTLIKLFSLFILYAHVMAAQGHSHQWIVDSAPETYIVQDGDTLWDIACKFLQEPARWKEVWHSNPEISDPNLIFPGDKIILTYSEDKPRLFVQRGHHTPSRDKRTGVIKLHPRVRELPAEKAIPTIPLHIISPFLNESRVVSDKQANHCPRIVALDEDHILVGTGDLFYVKGLAARNTEDLYVVFRPSKTYVHPKTKEKLGIEGHVLAKAQIDSPGNPARLIVRQSYEEVKIGDRITGLSKEAISPFFVPQFPQGNAKGYIISVFGGLTQIGQYQVLVITGGKDSQRQPGDVLAVYQTNKDLPLRLLANNIKPPHFPPIRIGLCMVFRVFDKVSYVLVMNAIRPIYLLDEVGKP